MNVKWKVMPCPKNAGRHPYHDHRWIVTEDAQVEFGHDERDWALSSGSLICEMRDVDPKFATLIAAAPELLDALQQLLNWGRDHTSPLDPHSPHALLVDAHNAIAKATGGTK